MNGVKKPSKTNGFLAWDRKRSWSLSTINGCRAKPPSYVQPIRGAFLLELVRSGQSVRTHVYNIINGGPCSRNRRLRLGDTSGFRLCTAFACADQARYQQGRNRGEQVLRVLARSQRVVVVQIRNCHQGTIHIASGQLRRSEDC